MTTARPLDAPFFELTAEIPARPLPDGIVRARADALAAAREVLAIPDEALARDWSWKGGSEADVRYGAYYASELLERAEVEGRTDLAGEDLADDRAAAIIAPATAARWDLQGLLLSLPDAVMDADPGGGEWSIRLTLAHLLDAQRGFGWVTAWWAANPHAADDPQLPPHAPKALRDMLPDEETIAAEQSLGQLRTGFGETLDLTTERLAGLPGERLALGARWAGFAVDIGFRLGRWSSHIREHAIQVEKTLAMLGHVPLERDRLARLVVGAYGRAEAVVFGRRASPAVDAAAERIAQAAAEALASAAAARQSVASG